MNSISKIIDDIINNTIKPDYIYGPDTLSLLRVENKTKKKKIK